MSDWTAGYVADIGYTYGYYAELNPNRVKLAFINQGLVFPEVGTACELGFGQGLSANIHAAASVAQWHGTDFNPSQAGFAQELAVASGTGAKLYDEAFDEFCSRTDSPDFDYIGLHGIWSWISDENRHVTHWCGPHWIGSRRKRHYQGKETNRQAQRTPVPESSGQQ